MERPFETQLRFSYEGQAETAEELWWSRRGVPADSGLPKELGVAPSDVLLLYQ